MMSKMGVAKVVTAAVCAAAALSTGEAQVSKCAGGVCVSHVITGAGSGAVTDLVVSKESGSLGDNEYLALVLPENFKFVRNGRDDAGVMALFAKPTQGIDCFGATNNRNCNAPVFRSFLLTEPLEGKNLFVGRCQDNLGDGACHVDGALMNSVSSGYPFKSFGNNLAEADGNDMTVRLQGEFTSFQVIQGAIAFERRNNKNVAVFPINPSLSSIEFGAVEPTASPTAAAVPTGSPTAATATTGSPTTSGAAPTGSPTTSGATPTGSPTTTGSTDGPAPSSSPTPAVSPVSEPTPAPSASSPTTSEPSASPTLRPEVDAQVSFPVLDGEAFIEYRVLPSGEVDIMVEANVPSGNGWVGLGVSDNGKMVGSKAIIGELVGDEASVHAYRLEAKSPSGIVRIEGRRALQASAACGEPFIKREDGKLRMRVCAADIGGDALVQNGETMRGLIVSFNDGAKIADTAVHTKFGSVESRDLGDKPANQPTTSPPAGEGNDDSNVGAIVGGVIGGLVLLALIVAAVVIIKRRKAAKASANKSPEHDIEKPATGGAAQSASSGDSVPMGEPAKTENVMHQ